jgi:transcriptional regulator with XRE-family HTH domain
MATAKHNRARRAHSPTLPLLPRRKPAPQSFPGDTAMDAGALRRALGDSTLTGALMETRTGLEVAKSAAYVSSVALRAQAADNDTDVALVLRRIVADEIGRQVDRIDLLLGGGCAMSASEELPVAFGRLLKQRLVERGWEPAQFAASTGLAGEDGLRHLESGEAEPTLTELFRIASALGEAPAIFFIDLIAAWREGPVRDLLYRSRASDFARLYRLGYYPSLVEFQELPRAYELMNDATQAVRVLNAKRGGHRQPLVDHVSIYVRLGYIRFDPNENKVGEK